MFLFLQNKQYMPGFKPTTTHFWVSRLATRLSLPLRYIIIIYVYCYKYFYLKLVKPYFDASLPDGGEFVLQHVYELSLGDAVPVHDDAVRLEPARALVEHQQQLLHHAAHLLDYFLSGKRTSPLLSICLIQKNIITYCRRELEKPWLLTVLLINIW